MNTEIFEWGKKSRKEPRELEITMAEELNSGRRVNRQETIAAEKKWTWACDQLKANNWSAENLK